MSQPPATADEAAGYQPFSSLAIAGFGLAVLCAAALLVMAGVALGTGVPLLIEPVVLGLPLLAFGLCLAGRFQVLHSEGTRTGLGLARWGMIVSALVGGGYWGWHFGKGLAVEREARAFADDWLARLRGSAPDSLESFAAFSQTQDPDRAPPQWPLSDPKFVAILRDQPERLGKLREYFQIRYAYGGEGIAPWPGFLNHDLRQLLATAGPDVKIEPRGLRSWTYLGRAAGGYQAELNYQIDTPEGKTNALVTVLSSGDGAQGRQWQVLLDGTTLEPGRLRQYTPLGETRQALRLDSREFARDWVRKLSNGLREEAFLDTLPPGERAGIRRRLAAARFAGLLTPALADTESGRSLLLPGYADFAAGGFVNAKSIVADPEIVPAVRQYFTNLFRTSARGEMFWPSVVPDDVHLSSPWTSDPKTGVVFQQPFTLRIPPGYVCMGSIRVAAAEPALSNAMANGTAVTLPAAQRPLRWRVVGVDVDFASILTRPGEK